MWVLLLLLLFATPALAETTLIGGGIVQAGSTISVRILNGPGGQWDCLVIADPAWGWGWRNYAWAYGAAGMDADAVSIKVPSVSGTYVLQFWSQCNTLVATGSTITVPVLPYKTVVIGAQTRGRLDPPLGICGADDWLYVPELPTLPAVKDQNHLSALAKGYLRMKGGQQYGLWGFPTQRLEVGWITFGDDHPGQVRLYTLRTGFGGGGYTFHPFPISPKQWLHVIIRCCEADGRWFYEEVVTKTGLRFQGEMYWVVWYQDTLTGDWHKLVRVQASEAGFDMAPAPVVEQNVEFVAPQGMVLPWVGFWGAWLTAYTPPVWPYYLQPIGVDLDARINCVDDIPPLIFGGPKLPFAPFKSEGSWDGSWETIVTPHPPYVNNWYWPYTYGDAYSP